MVIKKINFYIYFYLGTSIDEDFSEEMMRNPDFYGLNYISYKIISYSKPEIKQSF